MLRASAVARIGVVALAAATLVLAPAGGRVRDPTLHRDGKWLKDAYGRVVLLHGVNTVWKVAPFLPPDEPGGVTDDDMALMAAHGWNTVRLGVMFEGLMPQKGEIDQEYLDAVDDTVTRFGRHGIHVLLDIHQDLMGAPWGNGFPAWAISHTPALEAAEPQLGFPLNALRPSHNLAWDFFWRNGRLAPEDTQGVVDYLGDALAGLAARAAGNPWVVGVEIVNEVWPGTPFVTCVAFVAGCVVVDRYVQQTWSYLTDRMRAAAPDLMVWWEPTAIWNETVPTAISSPPITPAVEDPNLGFAFHDYCGLGELATYTGLPRDLEPLACDVYHDRTWSNYDAFASRTNWPALVTEFGNTSDGTELERSLSRADERFVGWQVWHYGGGFGLREDPGDPFSAEQLRHLARTYPRAIAGTPLSLTFDADTGRMVFSYRVARLGVPTEIVVSDVHYPDGYTVDVTGGRVTSAPGASVITIAPVRDATVIRVVVSATSDPD